MRTHNNRRVNFGLNQGYNSTNQFYDDKFNHVQEEYSSHSCMSQRDVEGFNTDLNIFTAKYKIYDNVDFDSPSFYKKKPVMNQISEKKNDDISQISDSKYQFSYFKNQSDYFSKENNGDSHNQSSQKNIQFINSQHSNIPSEKKPIFGPFTSTKKEDNNNYNLNQSIELTRRNVFNQNLNLDQHETVQNDKNNKNKIMKRDMSVEQENDEIPDKKPVKQMQMSYLQQENEEEDYYENEEYFKSHKKESIHAHINQIQSDFKKVNSSNNKAYETPINCDKQRKGKFRGRIIDSSSAKQLNSNQNSNQSMPYKNLSKQVDLRNIIQNSSSQRRLTRRSTNTLHESFQKQIFEKQNQKSGNKRNSSNDKMKSEQEEILDNRRKMNESKKLKKLVKNKRRSEKIDQQSQKQTQMSQHLKNCAICLGIPEDSVYGVVKCSHEFCIDCIKSWAQVTNLCPMCRAEFSQIIKKNYNDIDDQEIIPVQQKKQRIHDDDEFYWEEADSFLDDGGIDEICYICETDQDEERLVVCDHCGFRICHTYCDDELLDDQVPLDDWFCHECRVRSELFN